MTTYKSGRWRFSDLISYFCNWFRADPRSQTFYTNVLLRFLSHSNFATLISRKECSRTLRKRMYCIRVLLAHYVQYTFRVGCPCCLFREGQRRPECVVSQCGNPRFFMAFDYDYTGNPALLDRRKVAFFASRGVSPAVGEQALRWAEACCATDRVVISGFQSPLEKTVFELLLKARHPVIWALGRALYRRYPPAVEEALAEQRILIFAVRNARRTGWQTAQNRNYATAAPVGKRPKTATTPSPRWPRRASTPSARTAAPVRSMSSVGWSWAANRCVVSRNSPTQLDPAIHTPKTEECQVKKFLSAALLAAVPFTYKTNDCPNKKGSLYH